MTVGRGCRSRRPGCRRSRSARATRRAFEAEAGRRASSTIANTPVPEKEGLAQAVRERRQEAEGAAGIAHVREVEEALDHRPAARRTRSDRRSRSSSHWSRTRQTTKVGRKNQKLARQIPVTRRQRTRSSGGSSSGAERWLCPGPPATLQIITSFRSSSVRVIVIYHPCSHRPHGASMLDLLSTLRRRARCPCARWSRRARLLGIEENNIRVSLARLYASGRIERDERGRYRLGPAVAAISGQAAELARPRRAKAPLEAATGSRSTAPDCGRGPARRRREGALELLGFQRALSRASRCAPTISGVASTAIREQLAGLAGRRASTRGTTTLGRDLPRARSRCRRARSRPVGLWNAAGALLRLRVTSLADAPCKRGTPRRTLTFRTRRWSRAFSSAGGCLRQLVRHPLLAARDSRPRAPRRASGRHEALRPTRTERPGPASWRDTTCRIVPCPSMPDKARRGDRSGRPFAIRRRRPLIATPPPRKDPLETAKRPFRLETDPTMMATAPPAGRASKPAPEEPILGNAHWLSPVHERAERKEILTLDDRRSHGDPRRELVASTFGAMALVGVSERPLAPARDDPTGPAS